MPIAKITFSYYECTINCTYYAVIQIVVKLFTGVNKLFFYTERIIG
jgi:hypothetical protein